MPNRHDHDRNFSDDLYWTGNPYGNAFPDESEREEAEDEALSGELNAPVGRTFVGVGPKGYRRSDDKIKEEVCRLLYQNHDVDASHIEVEVVDGCVDLKGHVPLTGMRGAAEDLIREISGVKDVHNHLHVDSVM